MFRIVERNIGRAGNFNQSKLKQEEWDRKYGKDNWLTGYEVNGKFLTREEAIKEIYNPSYFVFLDKNSHLVEQLINSGGVFNPHALFSNSVDIQAQTIMEYMKKRNLEFKGKSMKNLIPIGTYQPKWNKESIFEKAKQMGLKIENNKIKYPKISYDLNPFSVPSIVDSSLSIEDFWQSSYKCLAVKNGEKDSFSIMVGNAFDIIKENDVICVTTNGIIKRDGKAVMGKGIAEFARDNFKDIDLILAKYLSKFGNRCFVLGKDYQYKGKKIIVASFPTKHDWQEPSDIELIKKSTKEIIEMANKFNWKRIYLPIPGGSNGKLVWSQVKPLLEVLDSRFVVFSLNKKDFDK